MFGLAPEEEEESNNTEEEEESNNKYYEILGVSKTSSPDELKKAYEEAAIKNYRDEGGDPEKFKELARAYEVLSDPEKKVIYDYYGEYGFDEGRFKILTSSVHNSSRTGVIHYLDLTLEDVYTGKTIKHPLSRKVLCPKCKGKGSKSGASGSCYACQGIGMMQQLYCPKCRGTGLAINEEDKCEQCRGEKVVQEEEKILEVHVEKGMQYGKWIVFRGEADEAPDRVTGDVKFVLLIDEHPKFRRKHDDLFYYHTLNLTEALCGFQFALTHLDGRRLLIKSNPGEFIRPGLRKAIDNEGMPLRERPSMKGRLYIQFNVEFPKNSLTLSPDQCCALEKLLPPRPSSHISDVELDECHHARRQQQSGGAG